MESDDDCEKRNSIIIDNGSCFIKAGLSTEETSISHFRTCVGYPKNSGICRRDCFIGKQMKGQMNALELRYPIKEGSIENFDDMEKIWQYIFDKELEVDQTEYNIVLTQPIMSKKERKNSSNNV